MKANYDRYFTKAKINKLISTFQEKFIEGLVILGINNPIKLHSIPDYQRELIDQKASGYPIEWLYAQEENVANVGHAIYNEDLVKLYKLKSDIAEGEYLDILAILLFINSFERNDETVKFLITKTEIAECNRLKAAILSSYIWVENITEWNNEIVDILFADNELAHQELVENISSIVGDHNISDQVLIKCMNNFQDINLPLTVQVSYDDEQTFLDEETSLLMGSVRSNRLELTRWLVEQGANVNLSIANPDGTVFKVYTDLNITTEIFEILVASGRLIKDSGMKYFQVQIENQNLNLSSCYELFTWKTDFNTNLNNRIHSFKNWLDQTTVHNIKDLFASLQKFFKIDVDFFDDNVLKSLQDSNCSDVALKYNNDLNQIAKNYFLRNWQKSALICKSFADHNTFSINELTNLIGEALFNLYLPDQFSFQFIEIAGEKAQIEEDFDL